MVTVEVVVVTVAVVEELVVVVTVVVVLVDVPSSLKRSHIGLSRNVSTAWSTAWSACRSRCFAWSVRLCSTVSNACSRACSARSSVGESPDLTDHACRLVGWSAGRLDSYLQACAVCLTSLTWPK